MAKTTLKQIEITLNGKSKKVYVQGETDEFHFVSKYKSGKKKFPIKKQHKREG